MENVAPLKLGPGTLSLVVRSFLGGKPDYLGLDLLRDTLPGLGRLLNPPAPHTLLPPFTTSHSDGGAWLRCLLGSQTHSQGDGIAQGEGHAQGTPQCWVQGQVLQECWQFVCSQSNLQGRRCIHVTNLETEALRSCDLLEESQPARGSAWMATQA